MSDALIVLITATSAEEAQTIARTLIEEKLAACVSRFPVQSTYT
ncbi:MAG: divalent cation tolerance protein CutA, partial [Sodalinema sp.]